MSQEIRNNVANALTRYGALTTRRLIRTYGPKPQWLYLFEKGYIREAHTTYGAVCALTTKGRARAAELLRARGQSDYVPYIAGASSMADRAYLMDAIEHLEHQGYRVDHHTYKRAGKVGSAAAQGRKYTDQIIRTTMIVPEQQMRALQAYYRSLHQPGMDHYGMYHEVLGYPALYATISQGGIDHSRARRLLKHHAQHLDLWQAPLLFAVPDETPLLPLVRSINNKHRLSMEKLIRDRLVSPRPINDRLRLIHLPLPGKPG